MSSSSSSSSASASPLQLTPYSSYTASSQSSPSSSSPSHLSSSPTPSPTLNAFLSSVSPSLSLSADLPPLLLSLLDDFISTVSSFSCTLAKHRGSSTLGVQDVQMFLSRQYGMKIPLYDGSNKTVQNSFQKKYEAAEMEVGGENRNLATGAADSFLQTAKSIVMANNSTQINNIPQDRRNAMAVTMSSDCESYPQPIPLPSSASSFSSSSSSSSAHSMNRKLLESLDKLPKVMGTNEKERRKFIMTIKKQMGNILNMKVNIQNNQNQNHQNSNHHEDNNGNTNGKSKRKREDEEEQNQSHSSSFSLSSSSSSSPSPSDSSLPPTKKMGLEQSS